MKSKPLTITLLLLILLGLAYMWPFKKIQPTSATPKITETKTFSCPGMEGFTFEYPVFEGWSKPDSGQWNSKTPSVCTIFLDGKTGNASIESDPYIEVQTTSSIDLGLKIMKNQQGFEYIQPEDKNSVSFLKVNGKLSVVVSLKNVANLQNFPRDLFFQTIINSFSLRKYNWPI